uniref:BHLH domain-containing protein n=1 Tax=Romanomermis culicivorax TaxID=13658 RepID=A0A915IJV2_ROMCU
MQITCSSALVMETSSSSSNRRRRLSCSSSSSASNHNNNGHLAGLERKLKKPLMEKRRRARINRCLSELTQILLNESLPPPASPSAVDHQKSKMEKADILEMTVQYLKNKRSTDLQAARRHFVDGFQQCSAAVLDFVRSGGAGGLAAIADDEPRHWQTILAERLNEKLARSQNM